MKYKNAVDMLRNPDHITPEDVAQFALFERGLSDNNKYRTLCDLIVACEHSAVKTHRDKGHDRLEKLAMFYELIMNGSEKISAAIEAGLIDD